MPDSGDVVRLWQRRTQLRRSLRRVVLSRRRPLSALCAALAVIGIVQALRPSPPAMVAVTVAAHDLGSGTVLTSGDLTVRLFPAADVPAGVTAHPVGRTVAAPVRVGEPLTDARVVSPTLVARYPGRVAMPVRIADADAVGLLDVGDQVDLLAADPRGDRASYVAVDVPVVALPEPVSTDSASGTALPGRLVVVAVSAADVATVAGAAATDLLSVVMTR